MRETRERKLEMDLCLKIDFLFKYSQIFFPYSNQIYANEFPGDSPNDCPRNFDPKQMNSLKTCKNVKYPDTYGHYRETKFTQIKHHWFWKVIKFYFNISPESFAHYSRYKIDYEL